MLIKKLTNKILLGSLVMFVCASSTFAQDSQSTKIGIAKQLFMIPASSLDSEQKIYVTSFYDQCSDSEKDAIRSYMVEAIKDSLMADHKQFAINYIERFIIQLLLPNSIRGWVLRTFARKR